jgi:hypothetical protein
VDTHHSTARHLRAVLHPAATGPHRRRSQRSDFGADTTARPTGRRTAAGGLPLQHVPAPPADEQSQTSLGPAGDQHTHRHCQTDSDQSQARRAPNRAAAEFHLSSPLFGRATPLPELRNLGLSFAQNSANKGGLAAPNITRRFDNGWHAQCSIFGSHPPTSRKSNIFTRRDLTHGTGRPPVSVSPRTAEPAAPPALRPTHCWT